MATYSGAIAKREIVDEIMNQLLASRNGNSPVADFATALSAHFGHKVSVDRIDNLNLMVKIGVGSEAGPRYFNIKISEVY